MATRKTRKVTIPDPEHNPNRKPVKIDHMLKSRQAVELRLAGATYADIAEQLGYSDPDSAYKAVERLMAQLKFENAEELRRIQRERLNAMLLSLWPKVQRGETAAIGSALAIMDRMNRMLGVDALMEEAEKTSVHIDNVVVSIPATATSRDFIAALRAARGEDPRTMDLSDVVEAEVIDTASA